MLFRQRKWPDGTDSSTARAVIGATTYTGKPTTTAQYGQLLRLRLTHATAMTTQHGRVTTDT